MTKRITLPKDYLNETLSNRSKNPLWTSVLERTVRGNPAEIRGDDAVIENVAELAELKVTDVTAIVAEGGEVEGYPVWVELDAAAYETTVPDYLPNRDTNEDTPKRRKWSEYKDKNHNHEEYESKHYVPGNSFGTELKGSEIKQLVDGGLTVLDRKQFLSKRPEPVASP